MKKRTGIIILCLLLTLTAFSLTACGGLSGVEVDKETFNKAKENFMEALYDGPVTLEYSLEHSETERQEMLAKYSSDNGSNSKVAERSSKRSTNVESSKIRIVYDRNAIYINGSTNKEETSSAGSTLSSKASGESYFVKKSGYVYLLTKGTDGSWYSVYKFSMSGNMAEYAFTVFSEYAFVSGTTNEFDNYEYGGGRYNLKKSVLNGGSNTQGTSGNGSTYTYGDDDFYYMVFNGSGLYEGYEYSRFITENYQYTQSWGNERLDIRVTETVSKSQAKLTYSGTVNVPNFSDLTG